MKKLISAISLSLLFVSTSASAANFTWYKNGDGLGVIVLRGTIQSNDYNKLLSGLNQILESNDVRFDAIRLDTGGGNLFVGYQLSNLVKKLNLATIVPEHSMCASACFLIFAAGREKYAGSTSSIGVHSVSNSDGDETINTAASTVIMTRYLNDLSIPKSIIGKLVTTEPNGMAWLNNDELLLMNVKSFGHTAANANKTEKWNKYVAWAKDLSKSQHGGKALIGKQTKGDLTFVWVEYNDNQGRIVQVVEQQRDNNPITRNVCRQNNIDDSTQICTDFYTEKETVWIKNGANMSSR